MSDLQDQFINDLKTLFQHYNTRICMREEYDYEGKALPDALRIETNPHNSTAEQYASGILIESAEDLTQLLNTVGVPLIISHPKVIQFDQSGGLKGWPQGVYKDTESPTGFALDTATGATLAVRDGDYVHYWVDGKITVTQTLYQHSAI